MAEHPLEAAQITGKARALMLNLGNITDVRMQSMEISLKAAKEREIPVLLDLVGTACSSLRLNYAGHLLEIGGISILKGNMSELLAVAKRPSHSIGIDAGREDALTKQNLPEILEVFRKLSRKTGAVILASGREDLITNEKEAYLVSNGVRMLSQITGTGCMQGAICTAYLAGGKPAAAALLAATMMGIAGELAGFECRGPGSFQRELLDWLYTMEDSILEERSRIQKICVGDPQSILQLDKISDMEGAKT